MKRTYQIDERKAIEKFRSYLVTNPGSIQMVVVRSQNVLRYSNQQLAVRIRRRAVEVLWDVTTVDSCST